MSASRPPTVRRRARHRRPNRFLAPAIVGLAWVAIVGVTAARSRPGDLVPTALAAIAALALTFYTWIRAERARWVDPLRELTLYLRNVRKSGVSRSSAEFPRNLGALAGEVGALLKAARRAAEAKTAATELADADPQPITPGAFLTRSGLFDAPPTATGTQLSGDYSTTDMVNRLEPTSWHWIESSPAEQEFLGWNLNELRAKSCLAIVAPDDRELARETFLQAIERGEALGLVLRIQTALGEPRSIEINASARYGTNHRAMHLRCHVSDITEKVRAERALRIRTHELTRANQELRRINDELERLQSELREKNRTLAGAIEELSRKNQQLDEFAHVVSHDLQEPLRTLVAFSDFLLKDYGDRLEGEGQEFVRHLVDASRRMRAMILGMLNLSRAGQVLGEFQPVDLSELAAVIRTDLGELIRSRGAEVEVVEPLPTVWGDRVRLGQLLANLITNGLKYNRSDQPRVTISAAPSADGDPDETTTIAVADNGIGIDPQFHAAIFQLFRRLHTREEYEGTGAGLAICNKIVQAHGGRIRVASEPGRGSTFYIQFRRPTNRDRAPDPPDNPRTREPHIPETAPDEREPVPASHPPDRG